MWGMPGGWEFIIILIVALLLFGKRLPEVMRSMGQGLREFKKGMSDIQNEIEDATSIEHSGTSVTEQHTTDDANPYGNSDTYDHVSGEDESAKKGYARATAEDRDKGQPSLD